MTHSCHYNFQLSNLRRLYHAFKRLCLACTAWQTLRAISTPDLNVNFLIYVSKFNESLDSGPHLAWLRIKWIWNWIMPKELSYSIAERLLLHNEPLQNVRFPPISVSYSITSATHNHTKQGHPKTKSQHEHSFITCWQQERPLFIISGQRVSSKRKRKCFSDAPP